ncbi:MAG TPA: chromosomal replication initiator protein DnaA [Desulfobulbaceae bacterium]|nr:chromosomal replication initiator protein DnaA [Desulfobulbaceae bacterium]
MLWDTIRESLHQSLPENEFGLWIKPLCCEKSGKQELHLSAPDRFFRAWIEEHYLDLIRNAAREVAGSPLTVHLCVSTQAAFAIENKKQGQLRLPGTTVPTRRIRSLHPAYTFDHFMVGESNVLARSACDALSNSDYAYGNCLFMNSATGLGKSHLTQAVVHQVLDTAPATRLQYLTAQQFSAEMVKNIRAKSMDRFSRKYVRDCDLLLVEDVHTLTGKNKTQEELNTVLDYLIKSGRRVILTSAVAPRKLKGLDEDFRSRMTSGLVAGIQAPEYETRTRIIRHKAENHDLELSDVLVDFLARHLKGDVRRTESALIGIRAKSCLRDVPPDIALAREVLEGLIGSPPEVDGKTIRDFIGCQYNVSIEDLTSRSRKRSITFPRQVAMYLTRKFTDQSLSDIGALYNRDHSTVLHAIKVITRDRSKKTAIRRQLDLLSRKLNK